MANSNSNNNSSSSSQTYFGGLTQEQLGKIIFEEFSKSGFQFNNFNTMVPSIISRIINENGGGLGKYLIQMLMKGFMGSFNKK